MDAKHEGNVLVVDDDRNAVDILNRLLTKEGFVVQCAHGGREALAQVEAHPIDVILLDVMMPDMDGFQVCDKTPCEVLAAPNETLELEAKKDGLTGKAKVLAQRDQNVRIVLTGAPAGKKAPTSGRLCEVEVDGIKILRACP